MKTFAVFGFAVLAAGCSKYSPTEPVQLPPISIYVDASGCDFTVTSAEPLTEPATGFVALNGTIRWGVQIPRTPHYELVPATGQLQYMVRYQGKEYYKITECRYVAPYPFVRVTP